MSLLNIERVLPWRIRIWWSDKKRNSTLRSISKIEQPHGQDIYRAIEKTLVKNYSDDERALIKKIESIRDDCLGSSEEIEFIDFGAGDPDNPHSLQESRQGIHKKAALSKLAKHTSKSEPWSSLLFNLVKEIKPRRCLELGTCIGFSASYQCSAMMLNGFGSLVTLEGAPSFAEVAEKHLQSVGANNYEIIIGRFEDTLEDVLKNYSPFDFMFNDGHHDGQAMLSYFENCLSSFSDDAVLLFDDICAYPSMQDAWRELCQHKRVAFAIDFGPMGLIALKKEKGAPGQVYKFSF